MMDQEDVPNRELNETFPTTQWPAQHPSDHPMTELLNAEAEEEDGNARPLTRAEVITYSMMVAGAGNETTTRRSDSLASCSPTTLTSAESLPRTIC